MARRKTHPIIPAMLSFVVMGTGQIFNGEVKKGAALFLFEFSLMSLAVFGEYISTLKGTTPTITPFSILVSMLILIPWVLIWIWNVIDAYRNAK